MRYFKEELILDFIKGKGWTARKFCKECKITINTFLKILNQQLDFKLIALFKIAQMMNLEIFNLCW